MPAQQNLYVVRFPKMSLGLIMAENDPGAIEQAEKWGADVKSSFELYRAVGLGWLHEGHYEPASDQS